MLILGIDTGGTYTDGVILDRETRTVLHTAKALTTPENLSAGLTPTDLLHVSGTYREWDAQRARAGLREAAAACGIPAEKLERRLTDAVVRQLAADCR